MKNTTVKELSPHQFRMMQQYELEMILEVDRICRKYQINYVLFGGTLLGAVRNQGYIPWDDDADIAFLREDYELFKEHVDELNPDICYFQDHQNDKWYRWGYGKMRRSGTTYVRVGQEHLKSKTGLFIDIFPMDDVPNNTCLQMLVDFHCYCLRKILWSEVAKYNTKGFWKLWFTMLSKIPVGLVYSQLDMYTRRSRNDSNNKVRTLLFPSSGKLYKKNPISERYGMPKKWFKDRAEYEFEGYRLFSTKDYDGILKYIYGDYMKLPPENKRQQHSPFSSITFPNTTKE